jgi:hypothetical protein
MKVVDVVVVGKHTVFSPYDAGYQVALLVGIGHALFVYDSLCRCRQVLPACVQGFFYFHDFVHRHWSPCVAFYAALSLARFKVATKLLRQYVRRNQYLSNLENRWQLFHILFLGIKEHSRAVSAM